MSEPRLRRAGHAARTTDEKVAAILSANSAAPLMCLRVQTQANGKSGPVEPRIVTPGEVHTPTHLACYRVTKAEPGTDAAEGARVLVVLDQETEPHSGNERRLPPRTEGDGVADIHPKQVTPG